MNQLTPERRRELFGWQEDARNGKGKIPAKPEERTPMKFPESPIAHKYLDGLKGIEIGGSSHNSFNIAGCINVDCEHTNAHKLMEKTLCGEILPIDVIAEADDLPFDDNSYDFVINSHVIEHLANPIKAVKEWMRVVRHGGFILFLVPTRDMNPEDRKYPYTPASHLWEDYLTNQTRFTHPIAEGQSADGRGHTHWWNPMRFSHFIGYTFGDSLEIVEAEAVDSKAHNGCELLVRVIK